MMLPRNVLKTSVRTTSGRILEDWARARTESNLLYYLNHRHGITQWDHPEYIRIFDEMLPINTVRYAAYRMACKLRHLQTRFKFHEVSLQCLSSAFDSAGLRVAENSDVIPVKEIERVVLYIYRTTFKSKPVDVSLCSDLLINMILNTFDENRSGNIQVLKCKVLLVVMCGGRLQEKYRYLFNQIADHNNCCTRRKLAKLLQCFANITELLSEQLSFGVSLVPAAVESCFKEVEGDIGVTEEVFLDWLMQEPQTLVWWTTLYRLASAELVCHEIKCGVCKQRPIVGLRYQCLRCLGYNLCQDCFLHGRKSRNHKLIHPIQEYCHESSGKEWRQSIMKIVRHRLGKSNEFKPRYLTLSPESGRTIGSLLQDSTSRTHGCLEQNRTQQQPDNDSGDENTLMSRTICQSVLELDKLDGENHLNASNSDAEEEESSTSTSAAAEPIIFPPSPRQQIHSVIKQLEDGQKQLSNRLDCDDKPLSIPPELVEEHTATLQTQINKLKTIIQGFSTLRNRNLKVKGGWGGIPRMESTPIVGERGLHLSLSPIGPQNTLNDTAVLDNKENHYTEKQHECEIISSTVNSNLSQHKNHLNQSLIAHSKQNVFDVKETRNENNRDPKLSFTDLNWSELTSLVGFDTSFPTNSEIDTEMKRERQILSIVKERLEDDEEMLEVKDDVENMLLYLEEAFPRSITRDDSRVALSRGVIAATCEFGDAIANYVQRIPLAERQNN